MPLSESDVASEPLNAEQMLNDIGPREQRLCERIRVSPTKWQQAQYSAPANMPVRVVAVMGRGCLYFNVVERGWVEVLSRRHDRHRRISDSLIGFEQ